MKKSNQSILLFILLLLSILFLAYACSKDFDELILDDFDFTLEVVHSEKGFVFEPRKTSFLLTPEKEILDVSYFTTFRHQKGKGYYLNAVGDTLSSLDTLSIDKLAWDYEYMPLETGTHDIGFKVWDSNKRVHEMGIRYEIEYAPFTFILTKGSNENIINSKNPISLSLIRELGGQSTKSEVGFEIAYTIENGSGTLYHGNVVYEPGKTFTFEKGTHALAYEPTTLGNHTIIMTATAPDGATVSKTLELEVRQLDFSLNVTASASQIELDSNLGIRIHLANEDEDSNVTYEITHSFSADSEGAGTVRNQNGGVLTPGGYEPIDPASYNYTFTSNTLGKRTLYFDVRDSNGQTKRDSVQLEVANIPFSFQGDAESNAIYMGEPTLLNFELKSNGNTENIDYTISYILEEGDGMLTDNSGTSLNTATSYPIDLGAFALVYAPSSVGSHTLAFMVTDNYGQEVGPVVIDLEAKAYDFEVALTPAQTTTFVNSSIDLLLDINEIPEDIGINYEGYFTSTRSGNLILNGTSYLPGQRFSLNPNQNTLQYSGKETGPHGITFSIASDAGVTKTVQTTLTFDQLDFFFSGNAQRDELSVGELTDINFNISEPLGNSTFTIRYTISGNALLRDENGNTLNAGTIYDITNTNFTWVLEATSPGNIGLNFIVANDTGLEKTVAIPIEVSPKDYNFTVNANPLEAYTGESVAINFSLNELGIGGDTYELYFSNGSQTGQFEYDGNVYSAGERIPVPTGTFQARYTGISEANHAIQFTVQSSSGVQKTGSINIDFTDYEEEFDLTVSEPAVNIYKDTPFPFSFVVSAPQGHQPEVTYTLRFTFPDSYAGYMTYNNQIYREGEPIPLDYGSTRMDFMPVTEESFDIDFTVENSTGISRQVSESVTVLKKPKVAAKGEKRNINCGGLNGCDYEVLLFTCFETNCSEAYQGASLQQVEIRIYNRQDRRWDTFLYNYDDARGDGSNRYFKLEEEPSEGRLKYLDQEYEVRVMDTNGQWSETATGLIMRV
ncbi:TraQ conjugal transfer family protein [Maribacter flavus]|uniref:DUF3872 domain-containing protein n=1 Tax=Maribacter flavus TaxID=1658664 RepID=A0A5B2TNG0_9FLAO|nr:TraQ conjugal transfer family protein [Maribacter flavus]KAA2215754.1 DUF3872 domain-containing protein [Maribacter flavus]